MDKSLFVPSNLIGRHLTRSNYRPHRTHRLQSWRLGKLKENVAMEREKLNKAGAVEASRGGGSGAGEARRYVRRKLLDEAGDRECSRS